MTDERQIDGTTHAEKDENGDIVHKPDVTNTEQANITERVDGGAAQRMYNVEIDASSPPGWVSLVQYDHSGSNAETVAFILDAAAQTADDDALTSIVVRDGYGSGNSSNWGTSGETISVGDADARLKVDDSDSQIMYLQINMDSRPDSGVVLVSSNSSFGATQTLLDAPALTD